MRWSGRDWVVRSGGPGAPGPNEWSSQLPFVDESDHLHLRIDQIDGRWACSEIHHEVPLGRGIYQWTILSDLRNLDIQAVFGLFTYDWWDVKTGAGEVDIEAAMWGVSQPTQIEYSVQPVNARRNRRVTVGSPPYFASIAWERKSVKFVCRDAEGNSHAYTSTSPPPAPSNTTWPFLNLWLTKGNPPATGEPIEVVVASFDFST